MEASAWCWGRPLLFVILSLWAPPEGLGAAGWLTAAVAAWMAVWWMSEAIPVAATGLLPIVLLPILGIRSLADAAAPFANPIIFPSSAAS